MAKDDRLLFPYGLFQHACFLDVGGDRIGVVGGYPFRGDTGGEGDHVSGEDVRPFGSLDVRGDLPRRMPVVDTEFYLWTERYVRIYLL